MIIVPPVSPHTSALAIELGRKLTATIQEFQQSHPGMSSTEIQQALKMAESGAGAAGKKSAVLLLLSGLLLAGGFFALYLKRTGGSAPSDYPIMPFVVGLLVVGLLIVVFRMRR